MPHEPIRMCVFCRKRMPKTSLRRFVLIDGRLVEDKRGKVQARGAYICNSPECIRKFQSNKKGLLRQALTRRYEVSAKRR